MMRRPLIVLAITLLTGLLACGPKPDTDALGTTVAATLTAVAPTPGQAVSTPLPLATAALSQPGTVSGKVCYPSDGIPPMTAYLENVSSHVVSTTAIALNQTSYSLEVLPGTYIAYAWVPGFQLAGSYSPAVPCGLNTSCTEHEPLPFEVAAGAAVIGIDLCDWYGQPGDIPLPPGVTVEPSPTATTQVAAATASGPGTITGRLGYPSEGVPKLVIVAFNVNSGYWWWIGTAQNQTSYVFADLPAGVYRVVAYYEPAGLAAAYATPDHMLINVTVKAGETITGIDLVDWVPDDAYPDMPGSIDYP